MRKSRAIIFGTYSQKELSLETPFNEEERGIAFSENLYLNKRHETFTGTENSALFTVAEIEVWQVNY